MELLHQSEIGNVGTEQDTGTAEDAKRLMNFNNICAKIGLDAEWLSQCLHARTTIPIDVADLLSRWDGEWPESTVPVSG